MNKPDIFKEQNKKQTINNVMRWLLFGIFLIVAPPLYNVWYKIIIGFNVTFSEYIPDVLLALLSVSCNLMNCCIDTDKRIAYILRWILCIILGAISLWCWGLFYNIRFPKENLPEGYFENMSRNIFIVSTIIIICCAVIGVIVELYTAKKNIILGDAINEK